MVAPFEGGMKFDAGAFEPPKSDDSIRVVVSPVVPPAVPELSPEDFDNEDPGA